MLRFVTNIIKAVGNPGRDAEQWERIGGYNYGSSDMGRVPKWIREKISHMPMSGIASDGQYVVLEGRTFRYRIVPSGQGGPIVDVYRCRKPKRSGPGNKAARRGLRDER